MCKGSEEGDIFVNGNETTATHENDVTDDEISKNFNGIKIKDSTNNDVTLKNGSKICEDDESEPDNVFFDNR